VNVVNTCEGRDEYSDVEEDAEAEHDSALGGNLLTHARCGAVQRVEECNLYDFKLGGGSDDERAADPELCRPVSAAALGPVDDPAELEQMRCDDAAREAPRGRGCFSNPDEDEDGDWEMEDAYDDEDEEEEEEDDEGE
jgi:hypothetical protein